MLGSLKSIADELLYQYDSSPGGYPPNFKLVPSRTPQHYDLLDQLRTEARPNYDGPQINPIHHPVAPLRKREQLADTFLTVIVKFVSLKLKTQYVYSKFRRRGSESMYTHL